MAALLAAALTEHTLSFQFPAALMKLVKIPQQFARLEAVLDEKR